MTHKIFNQKLNLIVKARNGKILTNKTVQCHSWLKWFAYAMKVFLGCPYGGTIPTETVTDVTGSNRTYITSAAYFRNGLACGAGAGTGTYGIVVGTGTTPNSNTTYSLASKIAEGNGSGQLNHGATTAESPSNPSSTTWRWRLIRTFTNNSGSNVTVNEIGIYAQFHDPYVLCIARDVLGSGVTIPDGATLTVRYIFEITIS